jgi:hypothetical protein
VQQIFHYHAANEAAYGNLRSMAPTALFRADASDDFRSEYRGWFRFLVENHFLFDVLNVEQAAGLAWERYRSIVLPDIQAIDDTLANRLDGFVGAGGTLIASGESGFRDGEDEPRAAPALQCLGIRGVRRIRSDMRSSYFQIEPAELFPRFADTSLVYLDGPYIYADYAEDVQPHLKLIPPHPFGPPERCYYTQITEHPAFVVRAYGQGRAIYLPWLPGKLFHRQGHLNSADFAVDLLQRVAGVQPVSGNLSPMVEVTRHIKENGSCELLHLVNASGHFGNSFYAPVTMTGIQIEIPCEEPPASVRCLVSGQACDNQWSQGQLSLHLAVLGLFEAIQICKQTAD